MAKNSVKLGAYPGGYFYHSFPRFSASPNIYRRVAILTDFIIN
jgi:hypothetical protein